MKVCGAPGEIRTPDPLVRSQVLYPTELRARCVKLLCDNGLRPPRRLSRRAAHSKGRREIRPDEDLRAHAATLDPLTGAGNTDGSQPGCPLRYVPRTVTMK